jgi:hypothetical protein
MNSFSDELRIISPVAWAIAGGVLCILLMFVAIPSDHQMSQWPLIGKICFSGGLGLVLTGALLLVGYINADARRRGMRYVMWTLLAIFLPNSLGIILYFVLRDPLPVRCRKCSAPVQPAFTFCPQCGAEISGACPACKRAINPGWKRCAFCGGALAG